MIICCCAPHIELIIARRMGSELYHSTTRESTDLDDLSMASTAEHHPPKMEHV